MAKRQWVGVAVCAAVLLGGAPGGAKEKPKQKKASKAPAAAKPTGTAFTPLPEVPGAKALNASGVVALGDSRFLFCDNKSPDALFELTLDASGAARVERRPLAGLPPLGVEDVEGLTIAHEEGKTYVFAISSLGMRKDRPVAGGLVRAVVGDGPTLAAEVIPGFREWLSTRSPLVASAAASEPDAGGLNVEGLAWDPKRHALLVGLRTPLEGGKPVLLPVRVTSLGGAWDGTGFELLAPIVLDPGASGGTLGIRSIEYDESRNGFLVVLGRATSGLDVPFEAYLWDGNAEGKMTKLASMTFPPRAKPEGVATGVVAGKPVLVVMDDAGGYAVLPATSVR
jgi:hypothetical protein